MVLSCLPGASQAVELILSCLPGGCPMDPFLPPWCFASCPMSPFLPPWCLSGRLCYGQPAVEPTQDLPRTGPFAIEIVLKSWRAFTCLWCLRACPIDPFLPPWCLPGASQAIQMALSCLPGAFLVPRRLSKWILSCLPGASQKALLKASLCEEPIPGFVANWAARQ